MSSEIRIITLHQPWASLIALGLKKFETRSWATKYRGKLVIHAAKRPVDRDDLADISYNTAGHLTWEQISEIDYPLGGIVAIADLRDCLPMSNQEPRTGQVNHFEKGIFESAKWHVLIHAMSPLELSVGDWQLGRYAWKLENVIALPHPIPFKGGQGLRRLTDTDVLATIAVQRVLQIHGPAWSDAV